MHYRLHQIPLIAILVLVFFHKTKAQDQYEIPLPYNASENLTRILKDTYYLMEQSRYDSALHALSEAFYLPSAQLSACDQYYVHSCEAEIMYYSALFDIGINSAMRTLAIGEELHNDTLIGNAQNFVGLFLMNLHREEEAIPYFRQAASNTPFNHNKGYLAFQYHAFANLGECFLKLNQPDSAIFYSELSLKECEIKNRPRGIALALWNIGAALFLKKDFAKAEIYLNDALERVKETQHQDVVLIIYSTLINISSSKNLKNSAELLIKKSLEVSHDERITNLSRADFYESILPVCIQFKMYDLLPEVYNNMNKLFKERNEKQIDRRVFVLEEYFKKNKNIEVLTAENDAQEQEIEFRHRLEMLILAIACVLVITGFLFFRSYKQKQKIKELYAREEYEKQKKSQELAALSEKMEALFRERNRISSDLHDDVGAALSSIRIYSNAALIQFDKKPEESFHLLQKISNNTAQMMEQMSDIIWTINPKNDLGESLILRMKSFALDLLEPTDISIHFNFEKKIETYRINTSARRNLFLIFKEILNNALKHSQCSNIQVHIKKTDSHFFIEISDNGVGFDTSGSHQGNGLQNLLSRALKFEGEFSISSQLNKGTLIKFKFPLANISD